MDSDREHLRNHYGVFSDESSHNVGRFRSIAAISAPASSITNLADSLSQQVERHLGSDREFKWSGCRRHKEVAAATDMIRWVFDQLLPTDGRIDVLVWDTRDRRHAIQGRDDRANFERMFYQLHKSLMRRRGAGSRWHLRPDQQNGIDWDTIGQCLDAIGRRPSGSSGQRLLLREALGADGHEVRSITPVTSHEAPLCQLADLFAGLGSWCRKNADQTRDWLDAGSGQTLMFESGSPGARDLARTEIVRLLRASCKERKLGVSFDSQGYFVTKRRPPIPINFWHYEVQHEQDRAPTRGEREEPA